MPGMTLDESARRLGGLVWTERRLFEVLGGWVTTTPEPPVKVALASWSRRHGEHALALAALLPQTRDHEAEALVRPTGETAARFAAAEDTEGTGERLRALGGPLAGDHLRALEEYLGEASAVRDGPGMRVVAAVLAEDRRGFEALRDLTHE